MAEFNEEDFKNAVDDLTGIMDISIRTPFIIVSELGKILEKRIPTITESEKTVATKEFAPIVAGMFNNMVIGQHLKELDKTLITMTKVNTSMLEALGQINENLAAMVLQKEKKAE